MRIDEPRANGKEILLGEGRVNSVSDPYHFDLDPDPDPDPR